MKTFPKICILMATYNGEKFIEKQLESIGNQSNVSFDLYISDDNSSDKTIEIIEKFIKDNNKSFNIFLIKNDKNSGSSAMNFMNLLSTINLKKYMAIAFSDQDDIWMENKLSQAYKKLSNGNFDGYSSSFYSFDKSGKATLVDKSSSQKKYDYIFEGPGPGCTFMISKNLAEKVKEKIKSNITQINSISFHDWFIYFFSRSLNMSWYIDKNSYIYYRQHDNNVMGSNVGIKSYFKRLGTIYKGEYRNQIKGNLLLSSNELFFFRFIKEKTIIGNFILALYAFSFRRKSLHAIALFLAFIFLIF